jgi:hypothetical protein
MAEVRRANISLKRKTALSAKRILVGNQKLVYVVVGPKPIKYEFGRSRILYIGTTNMKATDELRYFKRERVVQVLNELSTLQS